MKNQLITACIIVIVTLISCKKIEIEDPREREIFGEWNYLSSSGGFSGGQSSGQFENGSWIIYKDHGKYIVHKSNGKTDREKFDFEKKHNRHSGKDESIINYKYKISQAFKRSGDTLFLYDQASDAFSYIFIKR